MSEGACRNLKKTAYAKETTLGTIPLHSFVFVGISEIYYDFKFAPPLAFIIFRFTLIL